MRVKALGLGGMETLANGGVKANMALFLLTLRCECQMNESVIEDAQRERARAFGVRKFIFFVKSKLDC